MIDRASFYDAVRSSLFGNRLSAGQVAGMNALLDSCERNGVTDLRHVANILGQVYHETGSRMVPVREAFGSSDADTIRKLDAAWAAGNLPWVKTPYWRSGWFGRGPIQLTHESNYRKMGDRLGVDLVANRSKALDPEIGADIAVVGMRDGMFRDGHTLGRYFNRVADDPEGARRIVNGPDGTDAKVAGYHRAFLFALQAAEKPVQPPKPIPPSMPPPDIDPAPEPDDKPAKPPLTRWQKFTGAVGAAALAASAWLADNIDIILGGLALAALVGAFVIWRKRK